MVPCHWGIVKDDMIKIICMLEKVSKSLIKTKIRIENLNHPSDDINKISSDMENADELIRLASYLGFMAYQTVGYLMPNSFL